MSAKPQPAYARLNQPPRSPNGRNRRSTSKNHSDPLDGAGAGAGGTKSKPSKQSLWTVSWGAPSTQLAPVDPGVDPSLTLVDWAKLMLPSNIQLQSWQKRILYGGYMPGLSQSQASTHIYGTDPSPPPIPYTGIRSGEILGHRAWLVTNTFDLCSLAHYFVWEPGKTVEGDINKMVYDGRLYSQPDRFGGVYAYSSFDLLRDDELVEIAKNWHKFPRREQIDRHGTYHCNCFLCNSTGNRYYVTYLGLAYGTVKLWGETIEHEKGYRASFAKLVSIDGFIGVERFDLAKLREKYLG